MFDQSRNFFVFFTIFGLSCYASSDVLEFTDANFEENVASHDIILVEFYAPWCGHCKKLAPEYEKAASKLKLNDPLIPLAKVDCTAEKATCDKYGVSGFPTLKIFRNGEFSAAYEGPREAEGIVKYMKSQVGPGSKLLESVADFDKFIANEDYSIIGFFAKETKFKDLFIKLADQEREKYRFAHTNNKDVMDREKYTDHVVIYRPKRLHNKFEQAQVEYKGAVDSEKLKKFLQTDMQGLCGHRVRDNMPQFDDRPLVVVYYNVDYVKDMKGTNYYRNRVLKVAKEAPKLKFAISSKEDFSHELEEFGLGNKEKFPLVAAFGKNGEKFPMEEEFSVENLKNFVESVQKGEVEPYLKSEPVPEKNTGPVKVVVAKQFKELVQDAEKDVLIEFYAPWCGHCKKLAPIYDELGETMQDEDVLIAKMDATANDVPPLFKVSGFPTIYWLPKNEKQSPISYKGGRELKDLIKYIAKEATEPLKAYDRSGKKIKKKKKEKEL